MKNRLVIIFLLTAVMAIFVGGQPEKKVLAAPEDEEYQSLPFSQNWTNTGLITTNDDWSGVPGIRGYRGDTLTASVDADPQTLLADDSPGVVDINPNETNPNTFATGGVTEFDITDDVVALAGSVTADAPYLQFYLNTTGWQNIQINYKLRDIDGSIDNAIQQVALHYRLGIAGAFTNVPSGYVADATSGPSLATQVTPVNVTLPAAVNNQAQVQIRIMTTNAGGNDEWVGVDDISVTGDLIMPDHTITLDGNVNEWSSLEKLGSANNVEYGITWDANSWYFSINDLSGTGFGDADFFLIGIDTDPTNETTNSGGGFSNGEFCGAKFPDENKPDFIARVRQNPYYIDSYLWNGTSWVDAGWSEGISGHFDLSGNGNTYEVRLDKTTETNFNSSNPVGFYLWQTNSSCEYFNAWPSENSNTYYAGSGTPGNGIFLYAHTRFQTTTSGLQPAKDGQRIAWASNTLSANSTPYNYFGGDDVTANNPWLRLTTTASGAGGASCTVRAKMVGTHSFTQASFTGMNRYVDFTLTNCTNLEVDVQMRYEESELNGITETATQFYHCTTLPCTNAWTAVSGGTYTRDAINNNLILTNVAQTQFSFWTVSDTDAPTALTLTQFSAKDLTPNGLFPLLCLLLVSTALLWARKRLHG